MREMPLPDVGLGAMILRRAALVPELPAISFEGETLRYAAFGQRIRRLAGALRKAGVNRGDRVAFLGHNHPVFLETLFAATAIGAIFVPLNFRLTGPELEFIINDAGVHTLLVDDAHKAVIDAIRGALCCRHYLAAESACGAWTGLEGFVAHVVPLAAAERVEALARWEEIR